MFSIVCLAVKDLASSNSVITVEIRYTKKNTISITIMTENEVSDLDLAISVVANTFDNQSDGGVTLEFWKDLKSVWNFKQLVWFGGEMMSVLSSHKQTKGDS